MPVVIRNIETGLFFGKQDWTQFIKLAERFKDTQEAAIEVLKRHIKHAEIVIVHGDSVVGGSPVEPSEH